MKCILDLDLDLAAAFAIHVTGAFAEEAKIVAILDQARLIKIPSGAETLVNGRPEIADLTLLKKNNKMIVTPKAPGETNFVALDAEGNPARCAWHLRRIWVHRFAALRNALGFLVAPRQSAPGWKTTYPNRG